MIFATTQRQNLSSFNELKVHLNLDPTEKTFITTINVFLNLTGIIQIQMETLFEYFELRINIFSETYPKTLS